MHRTFSAVPRRAATLAAVFMLFSGVAAPSAYAGAAGISADGTSIPSAALLQDRQKLPPDFGDPFNLAEQSGQPVSSGMSSMPAGPVDNRREVPSLVSYGKAFLPDIVDGTKRIFSPDIGTVALIGLGATGLAFALDHTVQDYFQNHQPISHDSHYGDSWGQGYVPLGLSAALFATGEVIDNKKLADTGAVSVEALAVTGVTTEVLKYLTHRERPNHQDNMSFPSGHASMTASFAASVSEMYDWNPFIAVPLFAYSAFVGASRIQDNMHHFSDVVAGWTLGTVVGMSFGRSRKEKNAAVSGSSLSITPYVDGTYKGVVFNWRF